MVAPDSSGTPDKTVRVGFPAVCGLVEDDAAGFGCQRYVDDPRLAAANLAAAAAHRGARFAYRRPVTSISRAGQVWRVEIQGNERVEAPVILNAAGPWSSTVNAMVGATADFTIEIAPMRQEVHHVPAPAPLREPGAARRFPGLDVNLAAFSRKREVNMESSGTVLG